MAWLAEQYGNLASVLGLVISIVILIVAARTQAKVEGARKQLLAKVDHAEASWSAASVETSLAELVAFCDARNWAFAIDRCSAVLRALHSLKTSNVLAIWEVAAIGRRIDDLTEIHSAIESKRRRNDEYGLDSRKRAVIQDFSNEVAAIRASLNRMIREV
jgi:hypothetical protein